MKTTSLLLTALLLASLFMPAGNALGGNPDRVPKTLSDFGFYLGLDDPYPSSFSLGVSYDFTSFGRLLFGIGKTGTVYGSSLPLTVGLAARFFLPKRDLTPIIGLGASTAMETDFGNFTVPGGTDVRAGYVYLSTGVSYTLLGIVRFEMGLHWSFTPRITTPRRREVSPYTLVTIGL